MKTFHIVLGILFATSAAGAFAKDPAGASASAAGNTPVSAQLERPTPANSADGETLQRVMQYQAALRAAASELSKLDDDARARRIAEIRRGIAETYGMDELAATREVTRSSAAKPHDRAAELAAEAAKVADAQARYHAAAAELARSWPANPTAEDYRRLEELK